MDSNEIDSDEAIDSDTDVDTENEVIDNNYFITRLLAREFRLEYQNNDCICCDNCNYWYHYECVN